MGAEEKPRKLLNVLIRAQACLAAGRYRDTFHSRTRRTQRLITRQEIAHVLRNGRREESKDFFEERFNAWNYAIRGLTVEERELRVVVSFDEDMMLIITAIDLGARKEDH
jgi:hypothetical protein